MSNPAIHELGVKVRPQLNAAFRETAINAGWPDNIVQRISVEFVDGDLELNIPDDIIDLVNSLEYGTPNIPPAPAIRKFNAMIPTIVGPYIPALIEQAAKEEL